MFANLPHRLDFADTRQLGVESALTHGCISRFEQMDASEQLADAADSHLLRLVFCVACATMTLALVSSLA
jgi:hypothetical protein